MRRLIKFLVFVPVGLAALGWSNPSSAGFVIESVSTGATQLTTDFTIALAIPKFDTKLGQLQDVVLSYSDTSTVSGSLTNTSASTQTFTVSQSTAYDLSLGSSVLLTNTLLVSQKFTSLAPQSPAIFQTATPSGTAGPLTLTSGSLYDTFANATSDIIVDFSTLTTTKVVGGGGNISTGIYTTAAADLMVRYDYSGPVLPAVETPEPSSLVMTALGGLVAVTAGWARRRTRA